MSKEIVAKESNQIQPHEMTAEQLTLIKTQICKGASNDELQLFLYQCKRTGLDPLVRQIYAVFRTEYDKASGEYKPKMSIQTSIDGMRLVAQRTGEYAGQDGPLWCGDDGKWVDVWLDKAPPKAAKVGVKRKGFDGTLWAVAKWDSYAQTYKKKNSNELVLSPMWAKMPDLMLAKCAEFLALRKGFPQELSGLYGTEEMAQAIPMTEDDDQRPEQPKQVVNQAAENPGEYVMDFTKGFKGQKLKDMPREQIENVLQWAIDNNAKPKFQEAAIAYLDTLPPAPTQDELDAALDKKAPPMREPGDESEDLPSFDKFQG